VATKEPGTCEVHTYVFRLYPAFIFWGIPERWDGGGTVVGMTHKPTVWRTAVARHWIAIVVPLIVPGTGILTGIVLSRFTQGTGGEWGDLIGLVVGLALGSMVALATLSAIAARSRGKFRAVGYGLGGAGVACLGLLFAARNAMSAWSVLLVLVAGCGYVVFAGRRR